MTTPLDAAHEAVVSIDWAAPDPVGLRHTARLLIAASLDVERQHAAALTRAAAERPAKPLPPLSEGQNPAAWLRAAREALSASPADVATAAGLSPSSVLKLEAARGPVRRPLVGLVAEGLAALAGSDLAPGLLEELSRRLDAVGLLAEPGAYDDSWAASRRKQARPDRVRRQMTARQAAMERLAAAQAEAVL